MRWLLILWCAFFCSCAKKESVPQQTIQLALSSDPATLDPRKARDLESTTLLHMLFEGLTRVSQNGSVQLALAKSVFISEDGLRYEFSLRESRWSNGDLLTAQDFVEGWKAILDPHFPTDIAYHLYVIKNGRAAKLGKVPLSAVGLSAPCPDLLVVELETPVPYFLDLLAMSPFFPIPSKIVEQRSSWALDPATYVCNGPFLLQKWAHADSLSFRKNPQYWEAPKVSLERVDVHIAAADTALRMFEGGKLDWVGSPLSTIPADAIVALKERGVLQVQPFAATYFFRINTKKGLLALPEFRKALSMALDRRALVEHVLQGGQKSARGLVPPEILGSAENSPLVEYNLEEARRLFEKVKREQGSITLSYSNNERNAALAQAVQQQWEKGLGLSIKLEAVEPKVFFQRVSRGDFQLAAGSWTADFGDPINFLEVFKFNEGSTNNTGWEKTEYIDLLNRSALCGDLEERKCLLNQAEQVLMEEMPIIPVFHFALNYLKKENLEGLALSSLGQLDLRWAQKCGG